MTTRTNTPDRTNPDGTKTITTKRACNGCGHLLGDITGTEMNAAIHGRPLPDVRRECPHHTPTAPEPRCTPATLYAGDTLCLEYECDHDAPEGEHCDQVRTERVCNTHTTSIAAEQGWDEITHAEPWPCQYDTTRTTAGKANR
ncbi:hypothetical protein [Streptomyces cinereoruber]|uniref:hypothetical protein n=1 Tax=Streptomyces cinereoruber TaxID=67260 RepID=UPI0036457E88